MSASAAAAPLHPASPVIGPSVAPKAVRAYLRAVPTVDEVGAVERAAALASRSVKRESKLAALDLAVRLCDLTTLEGRDTPGKVIQLAAKAARPDPTDPAVPPAAALCVYPNLVRAAVDALAGSGVLTASVAAYFPSGQAPLEVKLTEAAWAASEGADEIDMVIDRGAFLSGDYLKVYEEIAAVREACRPARLKVILETGELGPYDNVRRASMLAMAAGADFIKTSTGKISPGAAPPVVLVMLEAIRDFYAASGRAVGMKPAGGISAAKQAVRYLVMVSETLGPDWLTPLRFRFGASSLLNDLLMQIRWVREGRYQSPDYFTKD